MSKLCGKRLLSLLMVILMVFPIIVSASSENLKIKYVYFEDESGNMVFVNYELAINEAIEGNHILYNAVRTHVGAAEAKGRSLYLETNTGKILDYKLAMLDNLFKLVDIIDEEKYEVFKEIKCTHELKVIDGKAEIVEIKEEIDSIYTIKINGPETLNTGETGEYSVRVYGDGKGNINYKARYEYEIIGGTGKLEYLEGNEWREIPLQGYFGSKDGFTLTPNWDVTTNIRFTPNEEGIYSIELTLKDLNKNRTLADAEFNLTVTKAEEPAELISIDKVNDIQVEIGTTEEAAKALLSRTTTIKDNKNGTHTVYLEWNIVNYNGNVEGKYRAIGTFELPKGINNSRGLDLEVEATITVYGPVVEPDWPTEVENVFVGESQITKNTYANINIKEEYISKVEAVYADDILANKMQEKPSQWRIRLEDGKTADDLKGKIRVVIEVVPLPEFEATLDKEIYEIDEEIGLTGVVSKENVELENIDITLKVERTEGIVLVEQLITANDGKFSSAFKMPEDITEGQYKITIKCHEPVNKTTEIDFMVTK